MENANASQLNSLVFLGNHCTYKLTVSSFLIEFQEFTHPSKLVWLKITVTQNGEKR